MRRWHSLLEIIQFPLKMLFVAIILTGLGTLITNQSLSVFWSVNDRNILLLADLFKRTGSFIIVNFPFFVMIKFLATKSNSSVPIMIGITGYVLVLVITMLFQPAGLPTSASSAILGLSYSSSLFDRTRYPLQTGFFACAAVVLASRIAYSKSRTKSIYGFFSFVDRDTWGLILTLILCMITGFALVWLWPIVLNLLNTIFEFIATDITNPMNLFVYGVMDRLLADLNLGALMRTLFWYGEQGGTWINNLGVNYMGDVGIWTAQMNSLITPSGVGRLITPYYVLNLFAVPGMLIGFYTIFTDKMEKRRISLFFLLAILVSLVTGTLLPLELYLLILTPLLFVFHLVVTGALFGIFQSMSVTLGFSYTGSTVTAMPGTLFDFMLYVRNPNMQNTIQMIFLVGVILFVLYFAFTRFYFKYLALDLFNTGASKRRVEGFILAVGGLENIKMMHSSPTRLTIQVVDSSLINFSQIQRLGASRVVESRAGYSVNFGAGSTIIKNEINKRIKEMKRSA